MNKGLKTLLAILSLINAESLKKSNIVEESDIEAHLVENKSNLNADSSLFSEENNDDEKSEKLIEESSELSEEESSNN